MKKTPKPAIPEHIAEKAKTLYTQNLHHENAIEILIEAIHLAITNPMMTPEVKELAETIVFLLDERNMNDYSFDKIMEPIVKIVEKNTKSQSGSHAAKAKHEEDNKRKENIIARWAEGNFSTRMLCAEQEWDALGFGSLDTARKALRNSPNPSPWPAKKK